MTDTDTADARATADQCRDLIRAGAEIVRITVDRDESAAAVPEIRKRLDDEGLTAPLVGDFHFNGHQLLRRNPDTAAALSKYRINPANVDRGPTGGDNFSEICSIARDHGVAVRIGVNGGSLDPRTVARAMDENRGRGTAENASEVVNACMVATALRSIEAALECGVGGDRIIVSCKVSSPPDLIEIYRNLADRTEQPLHLGLTEAGLGTRGLVWSASAMAILLAEGIGDTIRVSLNPGPGGQRSREVEAAREILQALGLRSFAPTLVSCPGCGRTTSTEFQVLAQRIDDHIKERMAGGWGAKYPGVENLTIAVMGCIVNGPGESKHADIGISLPGTGEQPKCVVYADGDRAAVLHGTIGEISDTFEQFIDDYVKTRFDGRSE